MERTLVIFTDGACQGNGTAAARAGYGIHFPNAEFEDISRPFTHAPITSARAELYAIWKALSLAFAHPAVKNVHLYTDSEYCLKALTEWIPKYWIPNGWKRKDKGVLKPVKNLDIIQPLYRLYSRRRDAVRLSHVSAHTRRSDPLSVANAVADRLAVQGIDAGVTTVGSAS